MNHLYLSDCVDVLKQLKDENPQPLVRKAKEAGHIKINEVEFPQDKIQILTVEDLFLGKQPQLPFSSDKRVQDSEDNAVSRGLFD